jgi:hypothetical protein
MPVVSFHNPRYPHTAVPQSARCDMKATETSTWFCSVVLKQLLCFHFKYTDNIFGIHNVCETDSVGLLLYFIRNVYGLHVNKREVGRARLQCDGTCAEDNFQWDGRVQNLLQQIWGVESSLLVAGFCVCLDSNGLTNFAVLCPLHVPSFAHVCAVI